MTWILSNPRKTKNKFEVMSAQIDKIKDRAFWIQVVYYTITPHGFIQKTDCLGFLTLRSAKMYYAKHYQPRKYFDVPKWEQQA